MDYSTGWCGFVYGADCGGAVFLPMLQTVGGSFGSGFPGGSGGRAIRDVEIDVDPRVVYRIDDHRFFTFEKYVSCSSGGFVYYNDTRKKINIFAGIEGQDKRPQDEFTISSRNDVLSYFGDFVYAASDNIIAFPSRNVNYKYGSSDYFVIYKDISDPSKNRLLRSLADTADLIIIADGAVYKKGSAAADKIEKYIISKRSDSPEWVDVSEVKFDAVSQDRRFHCDDNIKPRRVKFIRD